MSVLEALSEEECYLVAILQDLSGIDHAEFAWRDDRSANGLFRAYPYQYFWWRCDDKQQIDQGGRSVGKSVSIQLRAMSFVFNYPGEELLLTAPELIHLDPVTKYVEERLSSVRLTREMLHTPRNSYGFKHRPFEASFINGARIIGRIPQKDGKGIKGCVATGTLVLTSNGMVPIEDVKQGDLVLTHLGRWRPVLANYRFENPEALTVRGGGHQGLTCSENHRLYARRHRNPQRGMKLDNPTWVIVSDEELAERWYLGSPTRFPFQEYALPDGYPDSEALFWVAGRYVADGVMNMDSSGSPQRIALIDDPKALPEIGSMLDRLGCAWSVTTKSSGALNILVGGRPLAEWLHRNFGRHADGKRLPAWLLGAEEELRQAFFDGYVGGDGHWDERKGRWSCSTASKELAVGLRLLSQTLGYRSSLSWIDPDVTEIMGRKLLKKPRRSWRILMSTSERNGLVEDGIFWSKVRDVSPYDEESEGPLVVHDLSVEEDHSYVADGCLSHNMHPAVLEMDEASDYPTPGWVELIETLKFGDSKSRWRVHGVTRGVRDYFHKLTESKEWTVHRPTAMHRGDWSEAERRAKMELYGGRDSPDYRRNILGLHGDSSSALFVLHRLMAVVDSDETSPYNREHYYFTRITDEWVNESGLPITEMVDPPRSHKAQYGSFWVGSDIGMCVDEETEIFTRRGWLTLDEVRVGDETLSIDEFDGRSYWTAIDSLHVFDDSGDGRAEWDMVAMRGQSFDALVTPRHRWLVRDYRGRLVWKTTMDLTTKDAIPYAVPRGDIPENPTYEDDLVRLAAWFFTEGSVQRGTCQITQSFTANPENVERIRDCLTGLFGPAGRGRDGALWRESSRTGARAGRLREDDEMVEFHLLAEASRAVLSLVPGEDHVPTMEFLTALTEKQLAIFVDICVKGDGWTQGGRMLFQQGVEARTKAYEAACTLLGMAVATHKYHRTTNLRADEHEFWHTGELNRPMVRPVGAAMHARRTGYGMTVTKERYQGRVWCPKLSRGNWLARRHGSIYFTGNTISPTEILVFGEQKDGKLVLVTRVNLQRISAIDQIAVFEKIANFYRPACIGIDRTGVGLPIYQMALDRGGHLGKVVKGFNFSEKVQIGLEPVTVAPAGSNLDRRNLDPDLADEPDAAYDEAYPAWDVNITNDRAIMANVLEFSSDLLRDAVDRQLIRLPYDIELIKEFQGQTYVVTKSQINPYGRKEFSRGKFHTLDAARMAVLGRRMLELENLQPVEPEDEPVPVYFGDEW
jgi:hypothetical protein